MALMDGLEANEIKLSFICQCNTQFFRYDSEYYRKDLLTLTEKIATMEHIKIKDCYDVSKLAGFEYTEYFTFQNMNSDDHYIAVTSKNIQACELFLNQYITIDRQVADKFLSRSKLKRGDVILSYTGEYRRALTLMVDELQLGPNVCRLRPVKDVVNPYYLSLFFNSTVGQMLLDREKTLSAQPTVAMERIRQIAVPILGKLQIVLKKCVIEADKKICASEEQYWEATKIVNSIFSSDFVTDNKNVVQFALSFERYGRLDAEYYQPKYDEIQRALHTTETISSICRLYDMNFEPNPDASYDYIELANVGTAGQISGVEQIVGSDLPSRARRRIKKGQVIVSSIEGSLSSCALVDEDYDGALCSTGFYVVDSEKINSETLLVLFKSTPIQLLMKQRCSGTILTAISKDEFLNMPFPLVDDETQLQIQAKVQESFRLRKEAKLLLDKAIKAVEMAIEIDETTALVWLDGE